MKKRMQWICMLCFSLMLFAAGCREKSDIDESEPEKVKDIEIDSELTESEEAGEKIEFIEDGKPITLMVYMVGSDLEAATAAATNDMIEMEGSGVDLSKVKLLIYTGGSPKWHNDNLEVPTDTNAVFALTENGFAKVTDFEAASMGESSSLTRFLQYGYDNYKSDTYGLILWDHGNGPVMGYGSDLQYEKDALTLPEIKTALQDSPFAGEQKLDFIGFDACLMASAELSCMVDDYAEYLIASQEVEPGFGWNYEFLEFCGRINTPSLIQYIIDKYISYSESYFEQNEFFKSEVTLAAVDLSYAKDLEAALDTLFGAAAEDVSGAFNRLALDRVETRAFGRATTGSEYDLVDIQALMTSMGDSYAEEAQEVQRILDQMVIYNDSNTAESCGLSMYYPYYNKKYYQASWKESYSQLGLFPAYINYLERYGQIWLGTDLKEYFSGKLVAEEGASGTYTLQLTEEQAEYFGDAGFYLLRQCGEDGYSAVYYSKNVTNENGLLTANFDGNVIYYGDDLDFKSIPLTRALDEVDGEYRYVLFPNLAGELLDFADELSCRIVLSVNPETKEVKVLDFSENTGEEIQTGKRPQVNLDDWIRIQFFELRSRYLTRDEDGRIVDYFEWPEGDWITWNEIPLADGLNFTYEPIYDDGEDYFLMFDVMDVQGNNYCSELYPITLEERPPKEEVPPTDAGMVESSSALILDREGVKLYLDLVKDDVMGQTSFCFRVENSNDFPIQIDIEDISLNDGLGGLDAFGYLTADPHSVEYKFITEISKWCMYEGVEVPEKLSYTIKMSNHDTQKTLINNESFVLHFGENLKSESVYLSYYGAKAEEQELTTEIDDISVKLLGAGYHLNVNNSYPEGDYADMTGILRIENTSSEPLWIRLDGINVNGISTNGVSSFIYSSEVFLDAGKVYYQEWDVGREDLEELGITDITSLSVNISVTTSDEQVTSKTLNIQLAEN